MFKQAVAKLALLSAAIYSVAAKPALPIPSSGVYRIINAQTGLAIHARDSDLSAGTLVIAQDLSNPSVDDQQWDLDLFESPFGTLDFVSSFIVGTLGSDGTFVLELSPNTAIRLTLASVAAGNTICVDSVPVSCFTSPSEAGTQIPLQPLVEGALNQTWVFEAFD